MKPDPFVHLPRLRDRLTPLDKSEYRATLDVLASWDERARKLGLPANWIVVDIVRLENGLLAEHWDVIQDEVTREKSVSGLPMFGAAFPS